MNLQSGTCLNALSLKLNRMILGGACGLSAVRTLVNSSFSSCSESVNWSGGGISSFGGPPQSPSISPSSKSLNPSSSCAEINHLLNRLNEIYELAKDHMMESVPLVEYLSPWGPGSSIKSGL